MRTLIGLMRTALFAALVLSLSGCSLYEGGDDTAGDVDGGALEADATAGMAGVYALHWECLASPCESPIAQSPGAAVQAAISNGDPTVIEWVKNGQPAPAYSHTGRVANDCIDVGGGMDGVYQRDAYTICVSGGDITWTAPGSTPSPWRVTLERL